MTIFTAKEHSSKPRKQLGTKSNWDKNMKCSSKSEF